ncbi:SDR family NAD(P)-dependent oxidoreductase [Leeuwenhoekiella marinoflava]|uniref:NAD(P)-dependent dehydrogenase (Short-subunit alcohol dehydrogenase family) n=2 Tax=Leeuwenhoekiella marinoflava TaxID=988 RepID=A0A4Q0PMW8_9FLAO|nr:SDR family NAD(P)-dependent oxidoreductase [Leeuwenhoekiella marinoflava]RXG31817.1 NAD(P)-dependent dehydrogenase (short-subunit alcohol dehydrogenase family) [Leeuwenhoekiella marinoflava]SHF04040.1 NAD(P)-dependent dehydrogenase, short-chain alcohol dehydrogenase family [Leeuwenhoekiella marinoflava DSM 3653]
MATILITGGHSGLGVYCSRLLASKHQCNLILAGRSPEKMQDFSQALENDYEVKVHLLKMDTSSFASVRAGVSECKKMLKSGEIESLNGIICNAGVRLNGQVTYTDDGYETTYATNYLGHVLLVELLIDLVSKKGRIVFTSSGTHDPDTADGKMMGVADKATAVDLANTGKNGEKPINLGKMYATSKLDIIQYAYELNRRLKKANIPITIIAFDPGATPGTGFLRNMPPLVAWLANTSFMNWVMKQMGITKSTADFSGASLAKITVEPAYDTASGKYFQANNSQLIERPSSKLSYDEKRAAKLWKDTQKLIHIKPSETILNF